MTKVLIYIRGGIKRYAIVAPNGVKLYGPAKDLALIGARRSASFQMELLVIGLNGNSVRILKSLAASW